MDMCKRGSLPRKFLKAKSRRQEPPKVVLEDRNTTPEQSTPRGEPGGPKQTFGGSGAKFAPLRNRRGVKSGCDGRVQGKILLNVSSDGKGKFSLSLMGGEGGQNGKRPAENNLSPRAKKRKFVNPK